LRRKLRANRPQDQSDRLAAVSRPDLAIWTPLAARLLPDGDENGNHLTVWSARKFVARFGKNVGERGH
jgi:hypothetical protein